MLQADSEPLMLSKTNRTMMLNRGAFTYYASTKGGWGYKCLRLRVGGRGCWDDHVTNFS